MEHLGLESPSNRVGFDCYLYPFIIEHRPLRPPFREVTGPMSARLPSTVNRGHHIHEPLPLTRDSVMLPVTLAQAAAHRSAQGNALVTPVQLYSRTAVIFPLPHIPEERRCP